MSLVLYRIASRSWPAWLACFRARCLVDRKRQELFAKGDGKLFDFINTELLSHLHGLDIDAVQNQIGEHYWKDEVVLFPAEEGLVLQFVDIRAGGRLAEIAGDVLISDSQKAAGPATRVVNGAPE
jgi:hypothetical protein